VGGTCENGSHPHGTPILPINGLQLRKVEVKPAAAARLHATVSCLIDVRSIPDSGRTSHH
jgi:hypothetical protein